jgi:hypothetical protein
VLPMWTGGAEHRVWLIEKSTHSRLTNLLVS